MSATEVAAITGIALRDVHRVIDEKILPSAFLRTGGRRAVLTAGLPLITFYFQTADRLTARERTSAIAHFSTHLIAHGPTPTRDRFALRDELLTIDFMPFVTQAKAALERLTTARRLVVSSPDVLGGTPVVRGTRAPVYNVAASVERELDADRVAAAYPSLTSDQIALCALYAKANPPRGRPSKTSPAGDMDLVRKTMRPRRNGREAPH